MWLLSEAVDAGTQTFRLPICNNFRQKYNLYGKELNICSDRILTCRINSICSPAKVGLVVTDFNYQTGS